MLEMHASQRPPVAGQRPIYLHNWPAEADRRIVVRTEETLERSSPVGSRLARYKRKARKRRRHEFQARSQAASLSS
jgi:hypothetical protein